MLGALGMPVRELFVVGSAAPCSLGSWRRREVSETEPPDWAIVERRALASLGRSGRCCAGPVAIGVEGSCGVIVDAARFTLLSETLSPLITAQIQAADLVAINKIDEVDETDLRGGRRSGEDLQ